MRSDPTRASILLGIQQKLLCFLYEHAFTISGHKGDRLAASLPSHGFNSKWGSNGQHPLRRTQVLGVILTNA